ncbi:sugar ABC transporter substrate-binding protein [Pseudohoeflea suaedae]|uniref:Sugar ABC transporter substrate-binding protein n=1 Tax=Pseudohoeflea suaedae TaxID=877384 RepID=A0A4R5PLS6_9HYPH|nr:substrate-binding domain-containing protein [Pseudohoeflea suaedae]TDH37896.1 sugar ABC transporter substrate-binding protein [Pseudohoeflea suaedae]
MKINRSFFATLVASAVLLATPHAAFAQEGVPATISASATDEVPAKFAEKNVRIAVVRQLNTGDVYQNWIAGIESEADRLGIKLDVYNADGENAKQALFLQQAVATKPDAIIVGWGFVDSLAPGLEAAKAANIPVITFDVGAQPSDDFVTIDQGDKPMMAGILEKLKEDLGGGDIKGDVIYVYVPGYQALDRRDTVWREFIAENPGLNLVAQIGVVNSNTAAQTADQARAAMTANPDVVAIVAPYDEFAKGASLAVGELGRQSKTKVYGMDISTADIAVMVGENSPWVVTATTDMVNVGAVILRTTAAKIAGQLEGNTLSITPAVITQAELRDAKVQNVEELRKAFSALTTPEVSRAPWMDAVE